MRQAEAAVYRGVEALAGGQHAAGGENQLADNCCDYQYEDRQRLLQQDSGIYHHADGYEKDSAEQILDRSNEVLDFFGVRCFGNQRAHDEGTQSGGEAELSCQHNHTEAQADGNNYQSFFVHQLFSPFKEAGDKIHTQNKP